MSNVVAEVDDSGVVHITEDGQLVAAMSVAAFRWFYGHGLKLHSLQSAAQERDGVVADDRSRTKHE